MLTVQQTSAIEHLKTWKVGALFMEPGTGKTRITGLAEAFKNEEFSRSWSPEVLTNKQE